MGGLEFKRLDAPDETREVSNGRIEVYALGGPNVYRMTLSPGWRWSTSLKESAGTESCQKDHLLHVVSGRLHVRMDDGAEDEQVAGQLWRVPPGHDAWVVGDEPAVVLDFGELRTA